MKPVLWVCCCLVLAACGGADSSANAVDEAPQPIDLSPERRAAVLEQHHVAQDEEIPEAQTALPDLFEQDRDPNMRVSGKVLTDEEAQTLQETVDGVELKLELKTK